MQAATVPSRSLAHDLPSENGGRSVEAMRTSVAEHGIAGSTFDRVAREAGVSRGLLHYYFGSKERLLVEVVRADCDMRIERMERQLDGATTVDQVIAALVSELEELIDDDQVSGATSICELVTA